MRQFQICKRISFGFLLGCLIGLPSPLPADDWDQWLGPNRDGVYREEGVIDSIPDGGLNVKWRRTIAGGYAGPSVSGGKVFLFDYVLQSGTVSNAPDARVKLDGHERLLALDQKTGDVIWEHRYPCPYEISYPAGPRATPTVDGDRVYLLGAQGDLRCLKTSDGTLVWKRNLPDDFEAEVPIWGFSSHPLVDETSLYTMVGGEGQGVVALDKSTGQVQWKALDVSTGYCGPCFIEAGGVRQLLVFHPEGVQGLDPNTGKSHWDIPVSPAYEMSVAQPMLSGDRLYVSAIHSEAVMIRLGKNAPTAREVWRGEQKNAVHCSNAPAVFTGDLVFGTDCHQGSLIAVDAITGDRLWETFEATKLGEKRFIKHGTAFLTRLGETDQYLIMSENGDLIRAELNRKGFIEKGRMHVVEPTNESFGRPVVWSHPAYADRTAYIRNDKEIVAVDLSAKQ